MGSENNVYKFIMFSYILHNLRFLHHASAKCNFHYRIFLFVVLKISKPSIHFIVCIFPYRTRIVYNKVSMLILSLDISYIFEYSDKLFRITGIHLASKCFYIKCKRAAYLLFLLFYIPSYFVHIFIL